RSVKVVSISLTNWPALSTCGWYEPIVGSISASPQLGDAMALDDDIRILSSVSLFKGFTPEQLRLLAFGAENLKLSAGRDLYGEGEAADSAYIVARGRIVLYRERRDGRVDLEDAGAGVILGELALIAESTRLTSARAEVDT